MKTSNKLQTALLMSLAVAALAGCGSRSTPTGSTDSSSTNTTSSGTAVQCNRITQGDVSFSLMTYKDSQGTVNPSYVRLKFNSVPSDIENDIYEIRFQKWTASSTGVVRPSSSETPRCVPTHIEKKSGLSFISADSQYIYNATPNEDCSGSGIYALDWYNLDAVAKKNGDPALAPSVYFNKYTFLLNLNDPNGDWKALQVDFYNRTSGALLKRLQILIPSFEADPAIYQSTKPSVLSSLHPFLGMLNQGWSTSQYQAESNTYCF